MVVRHILAASLMTVAAAAWAGGSGTTSEGAEPSGTAATSATATPAAGSGAGTAATMPAARDTDTSAAAPEADAAASATGEAETAEMSFEDVDLAAAEKIFKKSCRACHGNKGQGAASYPKINDKDPEYVAEMLKLYRSGERIGPNSILMIQQAKKLSDEDIASLAVYVSTEFE